MPFARAVAVFPVSAQVEGLRLSVARANPFTGIGKLFGMQDIEVGDTSFDRDFVVKGSDTDRVKSLMGGEAGIALRERLGRLPGICLGVSDDGREATAFGSDGASEPPVGSDVVYTVMSGAGSEELVALHALVQETLRGLYRIGSAGAA
jgi:hypothetical protein